MSESELLIPAIAFPPGEILQDELEAHGLTKQDLAKISPDLPCLIDAVIQEDQPITIDLARKLCKAFGISPEFWLSLESNYQFYIANGSSTN
jgi:addiction module HigA family antidote